MTRTLKDDCDPKALAKLVKDTPLSYKPQALEVVDIDWGGKGAGHKECTQDGEIAVSAALLYWATRNVAYSMLCIDIIQSWAIKNKIWKGNNALLEAAWSVCSLARAAEFVKYAPDAVVVQRWGKVEGAFFKWLNEVIMPCLKSEHIWRWKPIGNWHFSQICARMQIAILREDQAEWNWCLQRYKQALEATFSMPNSKCQGEISESCRDVTHCQFQLGGIAQAPEMALHQGVDIYDIRIAPAFELQARIMMKEVPEGFSPQDIKTPYGYWQEPVWHIAHFHFVNRKKMAMPKTTEYIKKIGYDKVTFHWGPNCLTHYRV